MSDKNLKTTSRSTASKGSVLNSLCLEPTQSDSFIPSPHNNRDEFYSLFGLINGSASPTVTVCGFPDSPDPISTSLLPIFWWKWFCAIQQNRPIDPQEFEQWLEIMLQASERANQAANTAHQAAKVANQQAEGVRATANKALTDFSTIQNLKEKINTEAMAIKTIKQNAEDQVRTLVIQAEAENRRAQAAVKKAEDHAKRAEQYVNDILNGTRPSSRNLIPALMNFLKKYKFPLLLGAIALIALLFLLKEIFYPNKPSPDGTQTLYVNPITGNDGNNGSTTAPFRTLPHALKQARAGDEIYLAKGDHKIERSVTIPANTTLLNFHFFNDIEGHWAAPFLQALAARGVIAGYPDGRFMPDAQLSRAEYAALLTKAFNPTEVVPTKNFVDVRDDFWAQEYIQRVYQGQFMKGFPESKFWPNEPVQKVQVIASLVSGLGNLSFAPLTQLDVYQDRADIPSWARNQVATATTHQLIVNYPELKQLNPIWSVSRAEASVMIYQALVQQKKMPPIESPHIVGNTPSL